MKRIGLIHLILSCCLFESSYCQDTTGYKPKVKLFNLSAYIGASTGIQFYNKKDSASVTFTDLVGLNLRHYFPKNMYTFSDLDVSSGNIILDKYKVVGYMKSALGFGLVRTKYNFEMHITYTRIISGSYSISGSKNIFGFGWEIESFNIPFSLEWSLRNGKYSLTLIGIKIPFGPG